MQALVTGSLYFFGATSRNEQCEVIISNTDRTPEELTSIANGRRGKVVFHCSQLLPSVVGWTESSSPHPTPPEFFEEKQHIHINLYEGTLEIYRDKETRIFKIEDIAELKRSAGNRIHLRFGSSSSVVPIIYHFHECHLADTFQQYIEFWQDSGLVIIKAFNMIDKKRLGIVSPNCLMDAMYQQDVVAFILNGEFSTSLGTMGNNLSIRNYLTKMLSLKTPRERMDQCVEFDFEDFFHLFLDIPMFSLFGCLMEWAHQCSEVMSQHLSSQPMKPALQRDSNSLGLDFSPLPGETVAHVVHNIKWFLGGSLSSTASIQQTLSSKTNPSGKQNITSIFPKEGVFSVPFIFGAMIITNYRVVLLARNKLDTAQGCCRYGLPSYFNRLDLPLSCVSHITLNNAQTGGHFGNSVVNLNHQSSFQLQTKDLRSILIVLVKDHRDQAETIVHMIQKMCFSGIRAHLFAYQYSRKFEENTWPLCDIRLDYERMHLDSNPDWQIFDNSSFELCASYPPYLVLPSCLSIKNIFEAAKHRSKQRLPVVTYRDSFSGCCLLRSAQPLVGMIQNKSVNDEILLNACRLSGSIVIGRADDGMNEALPVPPPSLSSSSPDDRVEPPPDNSINVSIAESNSNRQFYILDARGKMAATVNSMMGKGTEDVSRYQCTELEFCNIDNIHVMRTSHASLQDIVVPSVIGGENDVFFYSKLCESGWLKHTRQLLVASVNAAEKIRFSRSSVLVHCSDGWDRTAQICLLVQLMLDPHYRTLRGFCLLLEKEFCTFGYKFQDRCGHAEAMDSLPDERSPIFVQGLDAVYQIVRQFPLCFEFTSELLVFIADHVHSGLFGNFLGNCEKQRVDQLNVRRNTQSIWSFVFEHHAHFCQVGYKSYEGALWPKTGIKQMQLWERFFCRWNMHSHPAGLSSHSWEAETEAEAGGSDSWHDDWGDGV